MKTLQEIKSELLQRCEELYKNYLDKLDIDSCNLQRSAYIDGLYNLYVGFTYACNYLGEDLIANIKQMEDRVHADRYIKSGIDEMLVNSEISGLPSQ
jgi:hypothetical protein